MMMITTMIMMMKMVMKMVVVVVGAFYHFEHVLRTKHGATHFLVISLFWSPN
jgi:hypothetical protein